jgi:hypothetical protein
MNMLNRISNPSPRGTATVALLCLVALASGCAVGPPRVTQAIAEDHPDVWATRIRELPVEVHGTVPGETSAQTIAAIDHGVAEQPQGDFQHTGLSLDAMPRVVVYVGGTSVPARDQYCALEPGRNRSVTVPRNGTLIRSELCDGPRPVAYARLTIADANLSAASVARAVRGLESKLVQSLPPPEPPLPEY